jgi:hypothetical protein
VGVREQKRLNTTGLDNCIQYVCESRGTLGREGGSGGAIRIAVYIC